MTTSNVGQIRDNSGNLCDYIKGLKEGQKLLAKITTWTLDDVGMSGGVFKTERFIQGQEYSVKELYNWNGAIVAYVVDETGCMTWATPDDFSIPA